MRRIIFILLVCSSVVCRADTLWMPSVFSDHMVLQQGRPVSVWGRASAGSEVTVEFSGQSNMEWALEKTEDAEKAIASATNTLIRLYHSPRLAIRIPVESADAR